MNHLSRTICLRRSCNDYKLRSHKLHKTMGAQGQINCHFLSHTHTHTHTHTHGGRHTELTGTNTHTHTHIHTVQMGQPKGIAGNGCMVTDAAEGLEDSSHVSLYIFMHLCIYARSRHLSWPWLHTDKELRLLNKVTPKQ